MKMDHKIISGRQESRLFFSCYLVEDPAYLHRLSDLEKAATHPIFSRLIQFKVTPMIGELLRFMCFHEKHV